MPNGLPPYPPEFRREAMKLVGISDKAIRQLNKDLGVAGQTLRNWVEDAEIDVGRAEGLTSDEKGRAQRVQTPGQNT